MRHFLVTAGWCVGVGLALVGAVLGSRAFDRVFQLQGEYSSGPRSYPDQDPAPRPKHR